MERIDKSNFMNKTFLTLLVGIGIGILIAPAKGSETWNKLKDSLDEYKDKLSDEGSEIADKGKELINRGKSRVEGLVDDFETTPKWNS
jgi:gas vesicle protein